jgi:DNA-binding NarL/FixJ family response regulator
MTVGIVSRFLLMRQLLIGLLASMEGFSVVLDIDNPLTSIDLIRASLPQILLIDCDDFAADLVVVRQLTKLFPGMNIVLLTGLIDDRAELQAIEAGAKGCISKGSHPRVVEKALHLVKEGQYWMSREVASMVAGKLLGGFNAHEDCSKDLTQRELEILALLARGQVNKEIACKLAVSENTVKAHLASIYRKLGVTTRLGAVLHYFREAQEKGGKATQLKVSPDEISRLVAPQGEQAPESPQKPLGPLPGLPPIRRH